MKLPIFLKGNELKIFVAVLLSALASGCASTYQDPRPLGVQQAELATSLKELSGQYDVIDARNDFYSFTKFEAKALIVSRQENVARFSLIGKEKTITIDGNRCSGRIGADRISPRLYCDGQKVGFFAPVVELATKDYEVTLNGGLLGGQEAMPVKTGDYLFSFFESGSGRPHYYLLKRRSAVTE